MWVSRIVLKNDKKGGCNRVGWTGQPPNSHLHPHPWWLLLPFPPPTPVLSKSPGSFLAIALCCYLSLRPCHFHQIIWPGGLQPLSPGCPMQGWGAGVERDRLIGLPVVPSCNKHRGKLAAEPAVVIMPLEPSNTSQGVMGVPEPHTVAAYPCHSWLHRIGPLAVCERPSPDWLGPWLSPTLVQIHTHTCTLPQRIQAA